jgi:predicted RNA binding protein YcfA (HicA-like mRNA interferase family)
LGRLKPQHFREVKRRLESAGFIETSQKGSHVKFTRQSKQATDVVIVPKNREVPVGTLRSILNQAHIDPDDWDNLG